MKFPFFKSAAKGEKKDQSPDHANAEHYARIVATGMKNENLQEELYEALQIGHLQTAEQIWELSTNLDKCSIRFGESLDDTHDVYFMKYWYDKPEPGGYYSSGRRETIILNPLAFFVHTGNMVAVDFLLSKGCNANAGENNTIAPNYNRFPIFYAVKQPEMMRRLLQAGAQPSDAILESALSAQTPDSVSLLLQYGASANAGKKFMAAHANDKAFSRETFEKLMLLLTGPVTEAKSPEPQQPAPAPAAPPPAAVEKKPAPAPAAAPQAAAPKEEAATASISKPQDADQIVYNSPLLDRTMQEVFNFAGLERITLIRKTLEGPIESVARDPFDRLQDIPDLQKAFDEHKKRGGKTPEEKVFPNRIPKPAAAARG